MKLRTLMLTSVGTMALATGAALAQIDADALVEQYQSQGYTRVEVKVGPSQVKVEAIRGTTKVETIYDSATGAVLKTETESVDAGDDTTPGVEIDNKSRDFLDDEGDDEDDEDDGDEADEEDEDEDEDDDEEDEDEDEDDEDDDDEEDDE